MFVKFTSFVNFHFESSMPWLCKEEEGMTCGSNAQRVGNPYRMWIVFWIGNIVYIWKAKVYLVASVGVKASVGSSSPLIFNLWQACLSTDHKDIFLLSCPIRSLCARDSAQNFFK